ncbi:2-oxo acid dehydrogenase subunit E2 [Brevibacterium sp. 50QC2O2]|jgi:pyruvate dehydrogenase E2 component (dihydrolipoamide acetyltransferase)|uniref:2-oxo acid dehydrogenase subunit E2 n=1 Tax=unclassified Brevibacterium TaxID=2614124 RepID=UPI00211C36FA|nr:MULTISPECIES: 2-oxo acid dehydrogenase subunit E2 [unclassified Brevibacterium]MCQ9369522.1 2-oxo acid dehydrogenase subunit E2 [Brevibacterium sp. 91QC2O2]MCQ9389856.1 2-oxo acid dehydrogenase subunit E2 [Brevibacterium sp. 50QC2O2]
MSIHALEVPKWGMTMEEGTLTEWLVDAGQEVTEGTPIATLESSKISGELEAPGDGVLARQVMELGSTLPVGSLVAVVAPAGTPDSEIDEAIAGYAAPAVAEAPAASAAPAATPAAAPAAAPVASAPAAPAAAPAAPKPGAVTVPAALKGTFDPNAPATPHAADLAEKHGIDLSKVEATGRGGRVTVTDLQDAVTAAGGSLPFGNDLPRTGQVAAKRDDSAVAATPRARDRAAELGVNLLDARPTGKHGRVTVYDVEAADWHLHGTGSAAAQASAAAAGTAAPVADAGNPATEVPMSAMRKVIATRLKESYLDSPAFRVSIDANIDKLLALRKEINDSRLDVRVSVNDLVVAAVAKALVAVPEVNVQYDSAAQVIRQFAHADVAVAVATDEGLITPIVTHADTRSITDISAVTGDLATRAKAGTLKPDEFQGGTFTISNLGMFGVSSFDAIINPPSAAILAVAAGAKRFVPDAQGAPVAATILPLTLTSDHRVIDGALAARFMAQLRTILETPALIFA